MVLGFFFTLASDIEFFCIRIIKNIFEKLCLKIEFLQPRLQPQNALLGCKHFFKFGIDQCIKLLFLFFDCVLVCGL